MDPRILFQADAGAGGDVAAASQGAADGQAGGGGTAAGAGQGAAGAAATSWPADLSPDFKNLVSTKGWKSPTDALASYVSLETTIGKDKIALPGENAKPEEWDAVYKRLGRPEAADKYAFKPDQGIEVNPELDKEFRQKAFEAGLSEKQGAGLYKWWNDKMATANAAVLAELKQQADTARAALKTDWGSAFDAKLDLANRVAGAAFGQDLEAARKLQLADGSFLLDHPVIAKALATIGAQWSEPSGLPPNIRAGGFARSPEEAKQEAQRLSADPKGPYWDKSHPEHKATVARVTELMKIAHPEPQA